MKLGARYGSAGWYAPPGVDLSVFGERGWLYRLAYECRLWVHLKCFHKHTTIAALAHGT